jgi:atlastin
LCTATQEDHLQQLALFSEYGRMALARDKYDEEADVIPVTPGKPSGDVPPVTPGKRSSNSPKTVFKTPKTSLKRVPIEEESDEEELEKPFQLLEFLVRDWQNFDDGESVPHMQKEMDTYLRDVIKDRDVSDLQV